MIWVRERKIHFRNMCYYRQTKYLLHCRYKICSPVFFFVFVFYMPRVANKGQLHESIKGARFLGIDLIVLRKVKSDGRMPGSIIDDVVEKGGVID